MLRALSSFWEGYAHLSSKREPLALQGGDAGVLPGLRRVAPRVPLMGLDWPRPPSLALKGFRLFRHQGTTDISGRRAGHRVFTG